MVATEPRRTVHAEPSALTRLALLDAAEALFASQGIDATSVRDITKAAGVNLSAVNYHFGSKDSLVHAVFFRRLAPLNDRRLSRLNTVVQKAAPHPAPLEEVLEAFVRPTVDDLKSGGIPMAFLRLLGRCLQEPNPSLERFLVSVFVETVSAFNQQFLRSLPDLPADDLFWRTSQMYGALHHTLGTWSRAGGCPYATMPGMPVPRTLSSEELVRSLVQFAAAGMRSGLASASQGQAASVK